jgi:hypothetical protein
MSDRVIIPLSGIGTLELPCEVYERCLRPIPAPAPQVSPAQSQPPSELMDAKGIASALSLPVSWIREKARQGEIPCTKAGRYVRFSLLAVQEALGSRESQSFGRA